ncbi:MAG: DUF488 domain-containing protein [Pseudomonadota bacterium]
MTDYAALYSIGYATKPIDVFLAQLKQFGINAVADVRSVPYSRAFFDYHQDALKRTLREYGIRYVFLGEELGPRSKDSAHYDANRQVRFDLLSQSELFQRGVSRLKKGLNNAWVIAVMCAEKDPADCHRSLLIGRALQSSHNIDLQHITHSGKLELQSELDERLTRMHNTDNDLFCSPQEKIKLAYATQNRLKAYRKP